MSLRGHNPKTRRTVAFTTSFLVVSAGRVSLALPADWIRGILTPDEMGAHERVEALGVIYASTDLVGRLGLQSTDSTADSRTILCSNGHQHRAFAVEQVFGLRDVDSQHLLPLPPHFSGGEREWFQGVFLFRETAALVVNPHWLLSDDRSIATIERISERRQQPAAIEATPSGTPSAQVPTLLQPAQLEDRSDAENTPWTSI
ncbi:MAG: chemotaxis protein CheW [Nitrospiraceae bacterium]